MSPLSVRKADRVPFGSKRHISGEAPDAAVDPAYHPLPGLLRMSAEEILAAYCNSQHSDFMTAFSDLRAANTDLVGAIRVLDRYLALMPNDALRRSLDIGALEALFLEVHEHVMSHPVWVHPLFVRFVQGDVALAQLEGFSRHYFNQVKNTRQCVALALGRFHTLIDRPDGHTNNALSELTQVVLARLLADEYGMSANGHHAEEPAIAPPTRKGAVDIAGLFAPVTHAALYRRFLDALGIGPAGYDVPMLHGVADNVLVQRILAGESAYDHSEALASVGLGMEWGVPAFFSMLIAGILKLARRHDLHFVPASMEIWSAHVRQDVEHAVAVMIVTSFYLRSRTDLDRVKGATNALMAFRYEMMSDIFEHIFDERCARVDSIGLDKRYLLRDRRIEPLLRAARLQLRPEGIHDYQRYPQRPLPRIFLR